MHGLLTKVMCVSVISRPHHHIITIAYISKRFQGVANIPIKLVEIDIGKNLTRQVANRNTHTRLTAKACDDLFAKLHSLRSKLTPSETYAQSVVVHMVKEFSYIYTPDVRINMAP